MTHILFYLHSVAVPEFYFQYLEYLFLLHNLTFFANQIKKQITFVFIISLYLYGHYYIRSTHLNISTLKIKKKNNNNIITKKMIYKMSLLGRTNWRFFFYKLFCKSLKYNGFFLDLVRIK